MILDLTDTGAGTSPEPGFQAAVRSAQAAGIRVIGYVATEYGQRPIAQAEADARNYKAWYGVSGIFLDQAPASRAQLGYYRPPHRRNSKTPCISPPPPTLAMCS